MKIIKNSKLGIKIFKILSFFCSLLSDLIFSISLRRNSVMVNICDKIMNVKTFAK